MYLKKTELEQALRENMESTLESYGGDSIAEDAIACKRVGDTVC